MASDAQLYDETFNITTISSGKYDRVSRLVTKSHDDDQSTLMTLDINHELFPCAVGEQLHVVLASTLSLDGTKDDAKGWKDWSRSGEASLADMYDYVCRGKIYRFEMSGNEDNIKVYISFGGLLMFLEGPYKKLTSLRIDYVYLLVKK